ncbi:MAG: ABC-2 family transporter protein [Candidatus Riflebacteria bacterium]|nr:ABC-2 family transporter protein [Candidatus Riflebacteria bacterium]
MSQISPSTNSIFGAFRKYFAAARIAAFNRFAYLGDTLSRPLFFAMLLFVFVQLWKKVFTADRPPIEGFGALETIWYLVITESILLSVPRLEGRVDEEVKSGAIAHLIGRPCSYVLYHLAAGIGETIPVFFLNILVGSVTTCFLIGPPPCSMISVAVLPVCGVLAFTLHIYISLAISLTAFWVEDAAPFYWIYQKMLFIFGGLMIPIEFFPETLRKISEILPFRAVLSGPARIFVRFNIDDALRIIIWQILWILIFSLATHAIFRIGARRVELNGG